MIYFIIVDNVSKILKNNRKLSITRLLNDTAKGLKHVYQLSHPSQEDLTYDLFKCSKKPDEASLGKLLSVRYCVLVGICEEIFIFGRNLSLPLFVFISFKLLYLRFSKYSINQAPTAGIAIIRHP